MHRIRPLVIDTGRNPFQVWVLVLCVITGAVGLLPGHRTRSSVIENLPAWAGVLWYAGLLLASSLGVVALALRPPLCLLVERAAMCLLGGWLGGYSVAVLGLSGGDIPVGAVSLVSAAIAAWWRVGQITRRDLPRLRAALQALSAGGG